ncbi:MAG TPA: hypothetical protein VF718_07290 [Allosphingosinicella sp.]|jgi:hypothetical protein
MSVGSLLKRAAKAVPAVLAAVPAVAEALWQVREALRAPPAGGSGDAPAAAGRLSADSERAAR